MRRKTERVLVASYLGSMGALITTSVWARQMVVSMTPAPRIAPASLAEGSDGAGAGGEHLDAAGPADPGCNLGGEEAGGQP